MNVGNEMLSINNVTCCAKSIQQQRKSNKENVKSETGKNWNKRVLNKMNAFDVGKNTLFGFV